MPSVPLWKTRGDFNFELCGCMFLPEIMVSLVAIWCLWCLLLDLSISGLIYNNSSWKIALLFLTRGPMPLEPVWDAFLNWNADPSEYSLYVHPHNDYFYTNDSIFYGHEVRTPGATHWGSLSQTVAIQSLVRKALEDPSNTWFVLMSEACIPLHPFQMWRAALNESTLSIVNACPHDEDWAISEDRTEINSRWKDDLLKVGFSRKDWRKSATWFALNRKHAQIFADDKTLLTGFANVMCSDEHILPTILAHYGQDNETACNDGFMHHWFPGNMGSHPFSYGPEHINPELFPSIDKAQGTRGFGMTCSGRRTLCHFTARKFPHDSLLALVKSLPILLNDSRLDHNAPYRGVNPLTKRLRVDPHTHHYYYIMHNELFPFPLEQVGHYYGIFGEKKYNNHSSSSSTSSTVSLQHDEYGYDGFHLPDKESLLRSVVRLTDFEIAHFQHRLNPFPHVADGDIVKTKALAQVYLVSQHMRYGIDSMDVFMGLGLDFSHLKFLSPHEISLLPIGPSITMTNLQQWKDCLKLISQNRTCSN